MESSRHPHAKVMPKSTIFLKSAGDQTWLEIPELNCYVGKSSIHTYYIYMYTVNIVFFSFGGGDPLSKSTGSLNLTHHHNFRRSDISISASRV